MLTPVKRATIWVLCGLIQMYRWVLSPFFGKQCRFQPTCSVYAQQAIQTHGVMRGLALTANRLRRCHPIHALGAANGFVYDPVPENREKTGDSGVAS